MMSHICDSRRDFIHEVKLLKPFGSLFKESRLDLFFSHCVVWFCVNCLPPSLVNEKGRFSN